MRDQGHEITLTDVFYLNTTFSAINVFEMCNK